MMRKPSCLISCTQPGPEGGSTAGAAGMGGGSSRALVQGNRWLFVGKMGRVYLRNLHGAVERGIGWLTFRNPCANVFTGPLRWPMQGACALPSVSCVAYWNEQRALGFAEGPLCFGGSQGPGKAELRRFSSFTHGPPRSKRRRSIVGVPQAALAPFAHFSGCGPARLRQCRGSTPSI
jgi:hypothetical protein